MKTKANKRQVHRLFRLAVAERQTHRVLFICIFLILSLPLCADVPINERTFPDATFRNYVKETIIGNANATTLTTDKIYSTTNISLNRKGVAKFEGIEFFTELERFSAENQGVESQLKNRLIEKYEIRVYQSRFE